MRGSAYEDRVNVSSDMDEAKWIERGWCSVDGSRLQSTINTK